MIYNIKYLCSTFVVRASIL